jgi:hypothetical protein
MLVKYGQSMTQCGAVYLKEDDTIEFRMKYRTRNTTSQRTFQFIIENFNFIITDTEVLVNKYTVDRINEEIEMRINSISVRNEV